MFILIFMSFCLTANFRQPCEHQVKLSVDSLTLAHFDAELKVLCFIGHQCFLFTAEFLRSKMHQKTNKIPASHDKHWENICRGHQGVRAVESNCCGSSQPWLLSSFLKATLLFLWCLPPFVQLSPVLLQLLEAKVPCNPLQSQPCSWVPLDASTVRYAF